MATTSGDSEATRIIKHDPNLQYVTLWQLSMILEVQPASLSKWVRHWLDLGDVAILAPRKKYGAKGHKPVGSGYSIPTTYVLVGRGWLLSTELDVRAVMLKVLPNDPKPWIVVVGDEGWTCYTAEEASQQVTSILSTERPDGIPEAVRVFYVGEVPKIPTTRR